MSEENAKLKKFVDDYTQSLQWHEGTSDEIKTYVMANIRGFMQHVEKHYALLERQEKYQHIKRGSTYTIIGQGILQTDKTIFDDTGVKIYIDEHNQLWFRTPEEMFDPKRFRKISDDTDSGSGEPEGN